LKQCWSVNVKSNFHLFKAALPTFNANPEGGAFLITSSIAVRQQTMLYDPNRLVDFMGADWRF
jgi:NADP-dependent 3-hydroxy acid dehydrogenase YdfG